METHVINAGAPIALVDMEVSRAARGCALSSLASIFPSPKRGGGGGGDTTNTNKGAATVVAAFVAVAHRLRRANNAHGEDTTTVERSYHTISVGCGCRSVGHCKMYQQAVGDTTFQDPMRAAVVPPQQLEGEGGDCSKPPSLAPILKNILYSVRGCTLFDGHAEVMARKGLQSYILHEALLWKTLLGPCPTQGDVDRVVLEVQKQGVGGGGIPPLLLPYLHPSCDEDSAQSTGIPVKIPFTTSTHVLFRYNRPNPSPADEAWSIECMILCVSEPPCGDCAIVAEEGSGSSGTGAHLLDIPVPPTASASSPSPSLSSLFASEEGRVLPHSSSTDTILHRRRTKPGKGFPTLSMCCTDKIAKWRVVGIPGRKIGDGLGLGAGQQIPFHVVLFDAAVSAIVQEDGEVTSSLPGSLEGREKALFRGLNQNHWGGTSQTTTTTTTTTLVRDLRGDPTPPPQLSLPPSDVGFVWAASPPSLLLGLAKVVISSCGQSQVQGDSMALSQVLGSKRPRDDTMDHVKSSPDAQPPCSRYDLLLKTTSALLSRLSEMKASKGPRVPTLGVVKLNTKQGIPIGVSDKVWLAAVGSPSVPSRTLSPKESAILHHFASRGFIRELLLTVTPVECSTSERPPPLSDPHGWISKSWLSPE